MGKINNILFDINEEITDDFLSTYKKNASKPQLEFVNSLSKEQLGILKTILLDYKFYMKNELTDFIKNNF